MPVLHSLIVKNFVTFEEARIELDQYPITIIRGANRDRRAKHSSNAVGKTALFGAIPNVIFGAPPLYVKKNSAKDMLRAGSEVSLEFSSDQRYLVRQFVKGGAVKYEVAENGVPKEFRKIDDCRRFIEQKFVMTEEQYYTTGYISPRDFHVLWRGKAEQRFDFFERVFNLEIYDQLFKRVSAEYNAIKLKMQKLEGLVGQRDALKDSVIDVGPLEQQISKLDSDIQKVQDRIAGYHEELAHISAYLSLAQNMEPIDSDELRIRVKEERRLNTAYREAVAAERDFANYQSARERVRELRTRLKELVPGPATVNELTTEIDEHRTRRRDLLKQIDRATDDAETYKSLQRRIKALEIPTKWKAKVKDLTAQQLSRLTVKTETLLRSKRDDLQTLQSLEGHKSCPTCQQHLSNKYLERVVNNLESETSVLQERATVYKKLAELLVLTEQLAQIKVVDVTSLTKEADSHAKAIKALEATVEIQQERQQIERDIATIEVTKVSKPTIAASDLASQLEEVRDRRIFLEKQVEIRTSLERLEKVWESVGAATERKDQLRQFIDKYQPRLDVAQARYRKISNTVATSKYAAEQLAGLNKQIKELQEQTVDFDVYSALRDAYGARGLRILQIRALAQMYCERLNQFANLLFPEPIRFEVDVDKSHFSIIAERNNGKSDVRRLSGSESTSFIYLSLLALLPAIPLNKRTNLLVSDEVETGMDVVTLGKFINEFLPELNQVIPNIVFITPKNEKEFSIPGARELVVDKRNCVSVLRDR